MLKPAIKAPCLDVFDPNRSYLRLLGITLFQEGTQIEDADEIALNGRVPLTVEVFWEAHNELSSTIPVVVTFSDHSEVITTEREFEAGPKDGGPPWHSGCVYKKTYEIDLPNVAHLFSGKGFMKINQVRFRAGARVLDALQCVRINIAPLAWSGKVSTSDFESFFGPNYRDLSVFLHLGLGARHAITVPERWREGVDKIGVVSGTSYLSIPQGEPVAEILVEDEDGRTATLLLRNGVTTARTDYDFYGQRALNHEKIPIVESMDAGRLGLHDQPFKLHKYAGVLDVPSEIGRIRSLTVRCIGKMVLDIWDIVLIPEEDKA